MRKKNSNASELVFSSRRKKILKLIKNEAAIFVNSTEKNLSRDLSFPYHHDSDFFYLTGHSEPHAALVLLGNSQGPRSILYLRDKDPVAERWNGERLGIKKAKRKFDVDEVRDIKNFVSDLSDLLSSSRALHYAAGSNTKFDTEIWKLFCTNISPRINFPCIIKDSRLITSEMRFIKDKAEIASIKHAIEITSRSFALLIKELKNLKSEKHAAVVLESHFAKFGANKTSFSTIVAAGKNSTILHHSPNNSPLWKNELLLIDAGASYNGYAADLTRTVPISGKFTQSQAKVYDIVHQAIKAGLTFSKPNNCLDDVHNATVRVIAKGLIDLKILKGSVAEVISSGAYKKYYMHRSGHWLGLDTHDISPITVENQTQNKIFIPANMRPFVPGNVFTLEPGIYIDAKDNSVPREFRGIGIRLEDDILITNDGYKVLSDSLPIARDEIEEMMNI